MLRKLVSNNGTGASLLAESSPSRNENANESPEVVIISPTTTTTSSGSYEYEGEASDDTESLTFFPLTARSSQGSVSSSVDAIDGSTLDVTRLIKQGEYPGIQAYLSSPHEDSTCAICQQSLEQKDRVFMSSPGCLHSNHHASCLLRWAKISNNCTCCKSRFNLAATVTFSDNSPGELIKVYVEREWEIKDAVPDEFMDGNIAGLVPGTALALIELHAKCCVCGIEDNEEEEEEKEVEDPLILCDLACGGAIHLKCSKYPAVPTGHWFCPNCENTSQGRISDTVAEVVLQQQMLQSPGRQRRRRGNNGRQAQASHSGSGNSASAVARSSPESLPTRAGRSRIRAESLEGRSAVAASSSSSSSSSWRISHLADLIASGVGGGRTRGDTVRIISSASSASLKRALSTSDKERKTARESSSPVKKAKRKERTVSARMVIDEEEVLINDDDDDDDNDDDDELKDDDDDDDTEVQDITSHSTTKKTTAQGPMNETALASSSSLNVSKYFKQSKYFQPGPVSASVVQAGSSAQPLKQTTQRPWEPKPIVSRSQLVSALSHGAPVLHSRPNVNPESFAKFRTAMGALRIIVDRAKSAASSPVSKSSSTTVATSSRLMAPVPSAKIEPRTSINQLAPFVDAIPVTISPVPRSLTSTLPLPSSVSALGPIQVPGLSESILKAVSNFISALSEPSETSSSNAQSSAVTDNVKIQLVDDRIWREALVDVLKFVDYPVKFLFQQLDSTLHVDLGRKLLSLLLALPFKTWDAYEMKVGIPSRPGVSLLCATLDSIAEREPLAAAFVKKLRSLRVTATTTRTFI